jgi:hypothetical protein
MNKPIDHTVFVDSIESGRLMNASERRNRAKLHSSRYELVLRNFQFYQPAVYCPPVLLNVNEKYDRAEESL